MIKFQYLRSKSALLISFTTEQEKRLNVLFKRLDWDCVSVQTSADAVLASGTRDYDVIVIDVDHVDLIDFGTGNDGYKRDWMEEVRD